MPRAHKQSKSAKKIRIPNKPLLLLLLIPLLFVLIIIVLNLKERQILKQEAQIAGCGAPGSPGNEKGVGKYCTKGGGQCLGTGAPFCSVDFSTGPGICSKPCSTDLDCGAGAVCFADSLGKGCKPVACDAPTQPTATPKPTTVNMPTATPTPRITNTPTPTPTRIPSPTPTIRPTNIPSATPTPLPKTTTLLFQIYLHGIGKSGDSANAANALSNKNPATPSRSFTISIYTDPTNPKVTKTIPLIYSATEGLYTGTLDLGTNWDSSTYSIKLKTDSFLMETIQDIRIPQAQSFVVPITTMTAGDVNDDSVLSTLDYNIIIGCFTNALTPQSCADNQKKLSDVNDDGKVDISDSNLFLREISKINRN
jgi:hypothetical protein